ncbi:hypothetical protein [Methylomonas sp. MgM2]
MGFDGRRQAGSLRQRRFWAHHFYDANHAAQHPHKRNLHGRSSQRARRLLQRCGLKRRGSAQRKERNKRDAHGGRVIDKRIVGAMRQVVTILDANDLCHGMCLRKLFRCDVNKFVNRKDFPFRISSKPRV